MSLRQRIEPWLGLQEGSIGAENRALSPHLSRIHGPPRPARIPYWRDDRRSGYPVPGNIFKKLRLDLVDHLIKSPCGSKNVISITLLHSYLDLEQPVIVPTT